MRGQVDVIYGAQMGDEGKGRFTSQYAGEGYGIAARYNGGANAGHTFKLLEQEINTHQIPSGITTPGVMNLITNSSLFDPQAIQDEMSEMAHHNIEITPDNLGVSESASLILPHHIMLDSLREVGPGRQGSTKRGIAFAAAEKFGRKGLFFHQLVTNPDEVEEKVIRGIQNANVVLDNNGGEALSLIQDPKETYEKWLKSARGMLPYMVDTVSLIHDTLRRGNNVLAEGAQSIGLDIDHGVRPENTSSLTGVAGAQQSLGISPRDIGKIFGVAKLFKSRVGGTPDSFPTKEEDEERAEKMRGTPGNTDYESGKSTGRKRDMGWFDLTDITLAKRTNGMDQLHVTKLDCLPNAGDTIKIATHYINGDSEVKPERPNHVELMQGWNPVYEEFPTWEGSILGVQSYSELPPEAKEIIEFIEQKSDTPIGIIGTGPGDDQKIDRR